MKKALIVAIASLSLLASCSTNKSSLGNYNLPTTNLKTPTKEGRACTNSSFFVADNDLSVETARQRADIKEIVAIEVEDVRYPFYFKRCVIVKGN